MLPSRRLNGTAWETAVRRGDLAFWRMAPGLGFLEGSCSYFDQVPNLVLINQLHMASQLSLTVPCQMHSWRCFVGHRGGSSTAREDTWQRDFICNRLSRLLPTVRHSRVRLLSPCVDETARPTLARQIPDDPRMDALGQRFRACGLWGSD